MPEGKIQKIWFRFARWLCRVFCRTFFRMSFYGKENIPDKGAFLLISNHQSYLDPLLCGITLKRPLYFLARHTLFKNKFSARLLTSVNTIPVRRGEADLAAIRAVINKLKQGNGVCLFPEATRSIDGKIAPFKSGMGLLCRRGSAILVPVVIDGAMQAWPKGKKLFSPGKKITVCYGKAITTEELKNMDDKHLARTLTDTLRQMQSDCRLKNGLQPYKY